MAEPRDLPPPLGTGAQRTSLVLGVSIDANASLSRHDAVARLLLRYLHHPQPPAEPGRPATLVNGPQLEKMRGVSPVVPSADGRTVTVFPAPELSLGRSAQ